MAADEFILWFGDVGKEDVGRVGGKNASLGEMVRNLSPRGVLIPPGFAVTAAAYRRYIGSAGIEEKLRDLLGSLNTETGENLAEVGRKVRRTIRSAPLPEEIDEAIRKAYRQMEEDFGRDCDVAVRSSATAEDLPEASFAGQQETFLNIRGEEDLVEACRKCFASLFTNRAISYRQDKGFDHFDVALSIGVQKMVRSDRACAGVIFTIDTETGFPDVVMINAAWGLGENVVRGAVNPDEYYVFKPALKEGFRSIIGKNPGSKEKKIVYTEEGGKGATREVSVSKEDRRRYCLEDEEILSLARQACSIEEHYGRPMDIEWAKDGETGDIFIVQARPETVQSIREKSRLETYRLKEEGDVLASGKSVGSKIGAGKAQVIKDAHDIDRFEKGCVLVTDMTDPDWEPVMKRAAAIVTNRGGRTCHAAIVSRELGIPCVIGTVDGTVKIPDGKEVTVSCAEGEGGKVYRGALDFDVEAIDLSGM
jgi:pyruvate,water dikinase